MILGKFIKQPNERKDYDVTFEPWLLPIEDSLDDVETSVECIDDPQENSLIIEQTIRTATEVKLWVSGGRTGYVYKVTLHCNTVAGRVDESEIIFVVEDF